MIREESSAPNDSPDVLAYRVGQLEIATATGLKEIKDELHNLQNTFVTTAELTDLKHNLNKRLNKLEAWNEWAVKIVFAIIISAVIALVIAKPTIGG